MVKSFSQGAGMNWKEAEHRITAFYRTILGRPPDPEGLVSRGAVMASGSIHEGDLAAELLATPKSRSRHEMASTLTIDHPIFPRERLFRETIAGRRIIKMLEKARSEWLSLCSVIGRYEDQYRRIPHHPAGPKTPHWLNDMLPALDAMLLYTLIAERRPRTYIEVGSGNSTKFKRS